LLPVVVEIVNIIIITVSKMSAFNQSGNVFLSSPLKDKVFCPNPTTERGFGLVINAHPK